MTKGYDPVAEAMARTRRQDEALSILAEIMLRSRAPAPAPRSPALPSSTSQPSTSQSPAHAATPNRPSIADSEGRLAGLLRRIEGEIEREMADANRS